jgi:hypothetical protein
MPALKNPKHEAFAQAVALGMPASQAYVEHVSRDGNCSSGTAEVTGCRLSKDSKVSLRIADLRKKVSEKADRKFDLTRDRWLDRLEKIADKAEDAEDYSAATGALREIGKAAAYYEPEEVRHTGHIDVALPDLAAVVAKVFKAKP